MKITCLLFLTLLSVVSVNAQVNYSGGIYTQNFNTLSQDTRDYAIILVGSTDPWVDNSTISGWYANSDTYTTHPTVLGLSLVSQLTSSGTGTDRALGGYLGVLSVITPISYGVRIKNNMASPMTAFTLSFTLEEFTHGLGDLLAVDVLNSLNIAYSTSATDISGPGATNYQTLAGSSSLLSLGLLSNTTDAARVQLTVTGLNLPVGNDLWIRWEQTALIGLTDNAAAIDDVSFSAVPEPSTYMLLGLGLMVVVAGGKISLRNRAKCEGIKKSESSADRRLPVHHLDFQ